MVWGELVSLRGIADEAEIAVSLGGRPVKSARFPLDGARTQYEIALFAAA